MSGVWATLIGSAEGNPSTALNNNEQPWTTTNVHDTLLNVFQRYSTSFRCPHSRNNYFMMCPKSCITLFLPSERMTPLHRGWARGLGTRERVGPDDRGELGVLRARALRGGLLRRPRPGRRRVGRFGRGGPRSVGRGRGRPAGPAV